MAIGIGTTASTSGTNVTTTTTFSVTTSGSNRLVFAVINTGDGTFADADVTAITYAGVTLGQIWTINNAVAWARSQGYSLPTNAINTEPALGANTFSLDTANTLSALGVGVTPFDGVHQTTPLGTAVTGQGNSDTPTVSSIGSATGEVVIAGCASDSDSATWVSGGTNLWNYTQLLGDTAVGAQRYDGAASVTATWTTSAEKYAAGGVSIKPAAAAGRTTKNTRSNPLGSYIGMERGMPF